jgi:hypothetical protein
MPGYNMALVQKRRLWKMWTSLSDLGVELIPASTSRRSVLRTGGGKYGSFLGTTPTRHPQVHGEPPHPPPQLGGGGMGVA